MEYYSYRDISLGQGPVRMHRFLTGREDVGIKPVYGLTAYAPPPAPRFGFLSCSPSYLLIHFRSAILLHAAMLGYGREPNFSARAPGERSMPERIAHVLEHVPAFVKAVHEEREELRGRQREGRQRTERTSRL